MRQFEKILKALANRRRLAIIQCLKRKGTMSVGDIAAEINLSFKATSKHLGILFAADIIEREQKSLQMFYSLSNDLKELPKRIISLI